MKANLKSKLRQMRNDNHGVTAVIGTIIMISIVATICPLVMLAMGNLSNEVTRTMNTSTEAMRVNTENMKSLIDYMKRFPLNPDGNNGSSPPDIVYELDGTLQKWIINYPVAEEEKWIEFTFDNETKLWDFYYFDSEEKQWTTLEPVQQQRYTLDVIIIGEGTVTKSPLFATYAPGTDVELTADATTGWVFVNWKDDQGALISIYNPTIVTVNGNMTVYAHFHDMSLTTEPGLTTD